MDQYVRRFLLSLTSFAIMTVVSMFMMKQIQNDMLPPEERDASQQACSLGRILRERWGRDVQLTGHEAQIAASVVANDGDSDGFEAVGGHEDVKRELRLHVVVPLTRPRLFFGNAALRPPSGVLLQGPPGTGKTLLANALAAESGVPFIPLALSDVENKWYGESQKLLRAVFSLAEKLQPCIVWVDEIDGLMRQRSALDANHEYGLKTAFLQMLDRVRKQQVIVVAATNCGAALDPAMRRRLPRQYTIDAPDEGARRQILQRLTSHESAQTGHIDWLLEATDGLTGSDIAELYQTASAVRNEALASDTLKMDEMELRGVRKLPKLAKRHWEVALERVSA